MGVHGIVDDLNKLQMGELPEEELRALEADLTGKVLSLSYFYDAQAAEKKNQDTNCYRTILAASTYHDLVALNRGILRFCLLRGEARGSRLFRSSARF